MATVEKSIFEYFQEYAAQQGSSRFLFDENRVYTVEETFREAIAIANRLHALGIGDGTEVALRSTRSLDAYLIFLALEFLGATAVLTNPHQTVEAFLNDASVPVMPPFVITNESAKGGIAANGDWVIAGHGSLEICYPARLEEPHFCPGRNLLAPAVVVFTSGSTGKNKGAMLSQQALLQYALDSTVQPWHAPDDIAIVTLPTQHGFALCLLITAFVARYAMFFPMDMHAEYVLECIEKYHITRINGVPSFFYVLARANEGQNRDVRSLRTGFTAGAPIIPRQHRYIEQVLGITLHPLYGMSESISISCTSPLDSLEKRTTTVGKFHRNAGCILDANGNELPTGQEGEICVSGPAILCGYYHDDEATQQAIDGQHRLHTGDLGFVDDEGYVHISGRIKDIIIRNGINLSPARIEKSICNVPQVESCCVVGVRHEMLGEAPCALVVLRAGSQMTAEELKRTLLTQMPKNQVPVTILFGDHIPLNKIGKPDKEKVKSLFWEW